MIAENRYNIPNNIPREVPIYPNMETGSNAGSYAGTIYGDGQSDNMGIGVFDMSTISRPTDMTDSNQQQYDQQVNNNTNNGSKTGYFTPHENPIKPPEQKQNNLDDLYNDANAIGNFVLDDDAEREISNPNKGELLISNPDEDDLNKKFNKPTVRKVEKMPRPVGRVDLDHLEQLRYTRETLKDIAKEEGISFPKGTDVNQDTRSEHIN